MADVIARLKLESNDYDSKIQRAKAGLLQLENECRNAGKSLNDISKENLEFVRSLGQMETVSKSARGKIGEMSQAFTDLSIQYKRLTDEEKNGTYGKALSSSLDQLKGRIGDAKKDLADVSKELNDTSKSGENCGGVVDALAGKFGLSTSALGAWGAALAAGTVALDVAKDAFFNNEQQLDEWGRVVESSQSVYEGFLNALNTGEINGFLNNINSIVRAASAAYDALDSLNTFNAFNQVQVEKTRTAMTESIVDYREGNAKKEDVKAAGEAYKKELEERKKYEREAYLEAIGKVAAERGVSKSDLVKALSGSYGDFNKLKSTPLTGTATKYSPGIMPGSQGSYTTYRVAANEQERLGEALRQLNDTELQSLQALGAQAERTGNEIAQVDRQLVRVLNGRKTTGGGGSGGGGKNGGKNTPSWSMISMVDVGLGDIRLGRSLSDVQGDISAWTKKRSEATDMYGRMDAEEQIRKYQAEKVAMDAMGQTKIGGYDFTKEAQLYNKFEQNYDSEEQVKFGEQMNEMNKKMGAVVGGINSIVGGVESLGVEIPDSVKQGISLLETISAILTGITAIVTLIETSATITAAATTTDALIPFKNGGIVPHAAGGFLIPGNDYSDRTPILAQSGELILNRAQQGNLASQLNGAGSAFKLETYVDGRDLKIVMNNDSESRGKGHLVTSRRRSGS